MSGQNVSSSSVFFSQWLLDNNGYCWWPPSKNVASFINKAVPPNITTWQKHKIIVESFCKSLSVARKKADDINYTSSEEFSQAAACRIRKKKKFSSDIWEDQSDSDDGGNINSKNKSQNKKQPLPPPPGLETINVIVNSEIDTDKTDIDNTHIVIQNVQQEEIQLQRHEQALLRPPPALEKINVIVNSDKIDINNTPIVMQNVQQEEIQLQRHDNLTGVTLELNKLVMDTASMASTGSTSSSLTFSSLDSIHLRKILDTVTEIKLQVKEINEKLQDNANYDAAATDTTFDTIQKMLPVLNFEQLEVLDNNLMADDYKLLFQKFINTIGGNGQKENIHRILKKVYSDEMAVSCSWLGQRKNIRMCDRKSIILIRGVMLTAYKMREKEFETVCAEWFRHAKQRVNRKNHTVT